MTQIIKVESLELTKNYQNVFLPPRVDLLGLVFARITLHQRIDHLLVRRICGSSILKRPKRAVNCMDFSQ